MNRHSITFLNENKTVTAKAGITLMQAMIDAGLSMDAPCGGNGKCGKCRVLVDGREALACQTIIDQNMAVMLPDTRKASILTRGISTHVHPDGTDNLALAIDIGTTTLVAYLLDGKTGAELAHSSAVNPQSGFGADVISRIQYTLANGGEPLQKSVREGLVDLIADVCAKAGVMPGQITKTAIVGNTAMHHLFAGINPESLVTPPYMPAVREAMTVDAREILPVSGEIRLLPNIAGFVGGDTVGCMAAAGFDRLDELTLMIDIGTNGEMVLGNDHRRIACSTAAGPAFEGAKITCGMRGAEGAIDRVWLENGTVRWHVIGDTKPVGLCGSGLLDLVAVLLELGIISESGRMSPDTYYLEGTEVCLTAKDVQEVQLAKAAIYAGIFLLTRKMGASPEDITRVMLAGAFGNYMDPASACRIGMIPACLRDRIASIGNAAGEGAKLSALSTGEFERARRLAAETAFLELASCPDFQDCYIDALTLSEELEIDI